MPLPDDECTIGSQIAEYLDGVSGKRRLLDRLLLRTER